MQVIFAKIAQMSPKRDNYGTFGPCDGLTIAKPSGPKCTNNCLAMLPKRTGNCQVKLTEWTGNCQAKLPKWTGDCQAKLPEWTGNCQAKLPECTDNCQAKMPKWTGDCQVKLTEWTGNCQAKLPEWTGNLDWQLPSHSEELEELRRGWGTGHVYNDTFCAVKEPFILKLCLGIVFLGTAPRILGEKVQQSPWWDYF